jgi:hypothetical protein
MKLSCLPVSLFGELNTGKMPIEDFFALAEEVGLDGIDISMNYLHCLLDKGIRAELHIYDNCGHGISLGTRETAAVADEINEYGTVWFDQLMRWMEELIR